MITDLAREVLGHRPRPKDAVTTALRQRGTPSEIEHRPWPLPEGGWFMGQSWRHLLFAHWRVEEAALRRAIPAQIPLDLYDGDAWLAVTPFRVEGLRLRRTLPFPFISRFLEVNVRTYVTYEGRPGIYFLSLDASSRVAVAGARRTYRLPYFHARQTLVREDEHSRFSSTRISTDGPPTRLECVYAPVGERFQAVPGTLEHWLTERYCLYTLAEGGTVQRAEIHHPPWSLHTAAGSFDVNTAAAGLGLDLSGDPLLHYSALQDVILWTVKPAST